MRAPWHLWVVGLLALLWNAGGAFDYLMTQLGNERYLAEFTPDQRTWFDARPAWFDAAWAFGVWGGVAGALLILLRSRHAQTAFAVALAGFAVSSVWSYLIADPSTAEMIGSFAVVMAFVVLASLVLFWLYARAMTRRGVLT